MRRRAGDLFFAPWWKTSSRMLSVLSIWRRCRVSRISRRFSSTRISSSPRSVSPFLPLVKILPRIDMSFLKHDLGRLLFLGGSLRLFLALLHGADLFLPLGDLLGLGLRPLHLAQDLLFLVVGPRGLGRERDALGELFGLVEVLQKLLGLDGEVLHGLLVGQGLAGQLEDRLERGDVLVEDLETLVVDVLDAVVELLHLPPDLLARPREHQLARIGDVALALLEQFLLSPAELLELGHGPA